MHTNDHDIDHLLRAQHRDQLALARAQHQAIAHEMATREFIAAEDRATLEKELGVLNDRILQLTPSDGQSDQHARERTMLQAKRVDLVEREAGIDASVWRDIAPLKREERENEKELQKVTREQQRLDDS